MVSQEMKRCYVTYNWYNTAGELTSPADLVGKIITIGNVILGFNLIYETESLYYIL